MTNKHIHPAVATILVVGLAIDGFGQTPFRGASFSADRMYYGVILVLVGLGLLVASGRHWGGGRVPGPYRRG